MTPLEYLRDPKAPVALRRLAYELAEGPDALRAQDEAEEAGLREQARSDAAEIPLKTA
jgi:hypothetical protein